MTNFRLMAAVAILSLAIAAPAVARPYKHGTRAHHRHDGSLYSHNYGPPVWPGATFAYYDGPLGRLCKQGAAAYRGQDGRPHPCH